MRRLRTTWGSRLIAGWLLACLVASVFATGTRGSARPACEPYAEWLRAQLRLPADAAVEAAIDDAVASKARSLGAFLSAFVEAYESRQPQGALAAAFLPHDLSNEGLITYLEGRFNGLGAEGVPVRGSFQTVLAPAGKVLDRLDAGAMLAMREAVLQPVAVYARSAEVVRPLIRLLRILSAAQPMGP